MSQQLESVKEVKIKDWMDLLPESPEALVPALVETDIGKRKKGWLVIKQRLAGYPWSSENIKTKALQELEKAKELDTLGRQKSQVRFHLNEIGDYLLKDVLQARGISTRAFWESFSGYNCYSVDNPDVELHPGVYKILERTRELPLELMVAKSKPRIKVDPILLIRRREGKWFKVLEW